MVSRVEISHIRLGDSCAEPEVSMRFSLVRCSEHHGEYHRGVWNTLHLRVFPRLCLCVSAGRRSDFTVGSDPPDLRRKGGEKP
jgi:hypothetical protein